MDFQLSREKSRKTEEVFLVGSRESEGKSKSPPNRKFSLRFGKEEMSTEDKRRRLRRLVPSWSFLTRQRFLLEKQKKMLCRTCKFAAVHRPLCSFPETPEASPMRGSCRRKATDEVGAVAQMRCLHLIRHGCAVPPSPHRGRLFSSKKPLPCGRGLGLLMRTDSPWDTGGTSAGCRQYRPRRGT